MLESLSIEESCPTQYFRPGQRRSRTPAWREGNTKEFFRGDADRVPSFLFPGRKSGIKSFLANHTQHSSRTKSSLLCAFLPILRLFSANAVKGVRFTPTPAGARP
jgi:hypothetical protein